MGHMSIPSQADLQSMLAQEAQQQQQQAARDTTQRGLERALEEAAEKHTFELQVGWQKDRTAGIVFPTVDSRLSCRSCNGPTSWASYLQRTPNIAVLPTRTLDLAGVVVPTVSLSSQQRAPNFAFLLQQTPTCLYFLL